MTVRNKILVSVLVVLLITIIFLVSLLLSKYQEFKYLQDKHNQLRISYENCHTDSANSVIEKELLYSNVEELTTTLKTQTKLIKDLTKQVIELKYNPIIVRAIPCDDVLQEYTSPDDNTSARGF